MIETAVQPPPENRLRRWWHGFYSKLHAMETSGYEVSPVTSPQSPVVFPASSIQIPGMSSRSLDRVESSDPGQGRLRYLIGGSGAALPGG